MDLALPYNGWYALKPNQIQTTGKIYGISTTNFFIWQQIVNHYVFPF